MTGQHSLTVQSLTALVIANKSEEMKQIFVCQKNVIQKVLDGKDVQDSAQISVLEQLISLLLLSSEQSLTDLVADIDSFRKLFNLVKSSGSINRFLELSTIETQMTKAHTTFYLEEEIKCLVFGSATSQLSEDQIKEKFEEKLNPQSEGLIDKLHSYLEKVGLAEQTQKQLRKV